MCFGLELRGPLSLEGVAIFILVGSLDNDVGGASP